MFLIDGNIKFGLFSFLILFIKLFLILHTFELTDFSDTILSSERIRLTLLKSTFLLIINEKIFLRLLPPEISIFKFFLKFNSLNKILNALSDIFILYNKNIIK